MRLKPFAALRPPPDCAARVAAVPYDVVDTAEARVLAAGDALSFLHVTRPEIDLPDGMPPHDPRVYEQGRAALESFSQRGVLVRDPADRLYVYRLRQGIHSQTGVVGCCAVDDYNRDVIRKHEKTRPDKEDDRTRHAQALSAHAGPVFLTYRDAAGIDAAVAAVTSAAPLYDFVAADGVRHTVWPVADSTRLVDAFGALPSAYVADGHHRAAAAARVAAARAAAGTGGGEADWFLAVLFPASHLRILPYNRLVRDLNGLAPEAFLATVGERFHLRPALSGDPGGPGQAGLYVAGRWYQLAWPRPAESDPVAGLDVSVLQSRLLGPVLGIEDPRTSPRIEFVGGIRGTGELAARVDRGQAAAAFALYPVTVAQMMAIADAGQIMPPKSTWFEPKLRSGLLIHPF